MNTRSIRFRLIVWHVGLLTGVFLLFGAAIYAGVKFYLERNLAESQLRRASQIAGSLLADIAKTGEKFVVDEVNARYAPEVNGRFIRITRGDGTVLYASGKPNDLSFDPAQLPVITSVAAKALARTEKLWAGRKMLIASSPFPANGDNSIS